MGRCNLLYYVTNIGIVRQADDNWINQYKGLFCVLNAAGHVVTWKMTKGLAMDDVEDMSSIT